MSYDRTFILKKVDPSTWAIYSEKGFELFVLHRMASETDAVTAATAWASSWNSTTIKVENEQTKKRD